MDKHRLSDYLDKAFWQVAGAVTSGAVGVAVFWFKRRWDAKDHYRIAMSQIRGGFDRKKNPFEYYESTFVKFEDAVFRFRPFLKKPTADYLSVLWSGYVSVRTELEKGEIDRMSEVFNAEWKETWGSLPKDKWDVLELFHKKFSEIAK